MAKSVVFQSNFLAIVSFSNINPPINFSLIKSQFVNVFYFNSFSLQFWFNFYIFSFLILLNYLS